MKDEPSLALRILVESCLQGFFDDLCAGSGNHAVGVVGLKVIKADGKGFFGIEIVEMFKTDGINHAVFNGLTIEFKS